MSGSPLLEVLPDSRIAPDSGGVQEKDAPRPALPAGTRPRRCTRAGAAARSKAAQGTSKRFGQHL